MILKLCQVGHYLGQDAKKNLISMMMPKLIPTLSQRTLPQAKILKIGIIFDILT
jgi:hypothetical protein